MEKIVANINSWASYLQCVDMLESQAHIFLLGWKESEPNQQFLVHKYKPVIEITGLSDSWTFKLNEDKDMVTFCHYRGYSVIAKRIYTLEDLKSILQQINDSVYNVNRLSTAQDSMQILMEIIKGSKLEEKFFPLGATICDDEKAILFKIARLYDSTDIKINFEQRISLKKNAIDHRERVNYFSVTLFTQAETDSDGDITETTKIENITNAIAALQTVIQLRESLMQIPDAPRATNREVHHEISREVPVENMKSSPELLHELRSVVKKNVAFGDCFSEIRGGYQSKDFLKPFVHITIQPEAKSGSFLILYHHGENDVPRSEKAERLVQIKNTAVAALTLLNECTRTYLDSQEKAMEALNGMLSAKKRDISYTFKKNIFHVNIRNGVASAEIKYKNNDQEPIFKLDLTYRTEETEKYKCFHPIMVIWFIESMITKIEQLKRR